MDARVAFLALVITSYSGDQFSNIDNAFVRVENVATRQEMARFSMTEKGSHTGLMVALLARVGRGWELQAIGDPLPGAARTPAHHGLPHVPSGGPVARPGGRVR